MIFHRPNLRISFPLPEITRLENVPTNVNIPISIHCNKTIYGNWKILIAIYWNLSNTLERMTLLSFFTSTEKVQMSVSFTNIMWRNCVLLSRLIKQTTWPKFQINLYTDGLTDMNISAHVYITVNKVGLCTESRAHSCAVVMHVPHIFGMHIVYDITKVQSKLCLNLHVN